MPLNTNEKYDVSVNQQMK